MEDQCFKTAILVFIRSAHEEVQYKRFYPRLGYRGNLRVARLLNRKIVAVSRSSSIPAFVISSELQFGDTFGERFSNAISTLLNRGFERVIAVGNDCLHLTRHHIQLAVKQLEIHNMVLGPTHNGGAYLIGLHRAIFEQQTFARLPWQQFNLLNVLVSYSFKQNATVYQLPLHHDANSAKVFKKIFSALPFNFFKSQILLVLGLSEDRIIFHSYPTRKVVYNSNLSQRGPP